MRRSSEREVGALLRRVPVPDAEGGAERAWELVGTAFDAREPAARRCGGSMGAAIVAIACAAAALAVALTPPGDAVANFFERIVSPAPQQQPARPVDRLPAAGKLLVTGSGSAWIVGRDGHRTGLGRWRGVTWSPRGLYVAGWSGRMLAALDMRASVRWRVVAPGTVHDGRWAPDGFLVAYRAGSALWVVAGNGVGAHPLAAHTAAISPAWRPGALHTLAWLDRRGRVVVADALSGRVVWRSATRLREVRSLSWSADGNRLVAVAPHRLTLLDIRAHRSWRREVPRGRLAVAAAWSPRGAHLAVVERTAAASPSPGSGDAAVERPATGAPASGGQGAIVERPATGAPASGGQGAIVERPASGPPAGGASGAVGEQPSPAPTAGRARGAPGARSVGASAIVLLDRSLVRRHTVFSATGAFTSVTWSPDGRWILAAWPHADQWLLVPAAPGRGATALARIRAQYPGHAFPDVRGWCCR